MTDFKVNDKVERIEPQTVTGINFVKYIELDDDTYPLCPDDFRLYKTTPVYPNPPHKHVDMICHVANGGVVKNKRTGVVIDNINITTWGSQNTYEIVQPKTKEELRIDDLRDLIRLYENTVNEYKRELEELKPNLHY